jgi:TolA-binding protein
MFLLKESDTDIQTIQKTYRNTINELNQQIIQLETEKQILNQQIENQSTISLNQERNTSTPGKLFMIQNHLVNQNCYVETTSYESTIVKKQTHAAPFHDVRTIA